MEEFSEDEMRDTAIELAEMLLLDPLDEGEEPEIVEDSRYENNSVPEIEEATGLEHPEEYEIIEYSSGKQLIHDQLSGNLEENIPEETESSEEDFDLSKAQQALEEISEKFGGLMEHDSEGYRLIFVPENIYDAAEKNDIEAERLERGVKIEEGIHATQKNNHPEIFEMKDSMVSQQGDPEKQNKFQALMSTVEGHALFYTDQLVPGYAELERQADMEENPGLAFMDIEHIETQYQQGLEFISQLYKEGGKKYTNLALAEPPESMEEVNNPQEYLQRVN